MTTLVAVASVLPLLAFAALFAWNNDAATWLSPTRIALRGTASEVLLAEAAVAPILAAIVGAAVASWRPLLAAIAALIVVSAGLSAALMTGGGRDAALFATIAAAHATLAATLAGLGALGLLCASRFRNPLDAAALGAIASLSINLALLAAGPAAADLPTGIVNAGLAASPLVATASAMGVDLLRTELLYRASPIAHLQFAYPEWFVTLSAYVLLALLCAAGVRKGPATAAPLVPAKGAP